MSKKPKFGVDAPDVTADEALEFLVHHLQLASMYFEAVNRNNDQNVREIQRMLKHDDLTRDGAIEFYRTLQSFYDRLPDDE